MKPRTKAILLWTLPILVYFVLAFDGNTHWDENNYLDKAAYAPFGLKEGWIHAWGGFYTGRLFHILILRLVFSLAGVGIVPLLAAGFLMALCIVGAGALFAGSTRLLGVDKRTAFFVFLCFIFSPLGLYLGYKSLAETTALFCCAAAVYLFLLGLRNTSRLRLFLLATAGLFLFAATFSRAESLLAFGAFTFPAALSVREGRVRALKILVLVLGFWALLSAGMGLASGLWAFRFFFHRSEAFAHLIARDPGDYPPNYVSALFFGGGMWILALLGLLPPWNRAGRVALAGLILSLAPLLLFIEHLEIRYFHPVLFPFALAAGLGLERLWAIVMRKVTPGTASGVAAGILVALVAGDQLLRPFQEVGVNGIPLINLVHRVQEEYRDPLLVTSSVPNTYSFLRVAFPGIRITGTPLNGMIMPLEITSREDLVREDPPWIFISTQGEVPPSLAVHLLFRMMGKKFEQVAQDEDAQLRRLFGDSVKWQSIARSGKYIAYRLE